MSTKSSVCYYVSGHGLGHASRAAQVMAEIPERYNLIVKSLAPEAFIRSSAGRAVTYIPQSYDLGVWQKSNVSLDWERTIREANRIQRNSEKKFDAELKFLQDNNVKTVVCDVPPFPLRVAKAAGIPSIAVVNFTWVEIYRAMARKSSVARKLVRMYRDDYSSATLALRTPMSLTMPQFPRMQDIPLIARKGRQARERLREELGISSSTRIVLLYFGIWEDEVSGLPRLSQWNDIAFVSLAPMPEPVRTLNRERWDFADIVASSDAVLAKPGYGTMGECMANGTPVVYYPRPEFAEYSALRDTIQEWGGAIQIRRNEFLSCRWRLALDEAFQLSPPKVDSSGAAVAGSIISKSAER